MCSEQAHRARPCRPSAALDHACWCALLQRIFSSVAQKLGKSPLRRDGSPLPFLEVCFWVISVQSSPTASICPGHLLPPRSALAPPQETHAPVPIPPSFSMFTQSYSPHLFMSPPALRFKDKMACKTLNSGLPSSLAWSPRKSKLSPQASFLLFLSLTHPQGSTSPHVPAGAFSPFLPLPVPSYGYADSAQHVGSALINVWQ